MLALLAQPIAVLLNFVEKYAKEWRRWAETMGGRAKGVFPAHTAPSAFQAEIEASVARWYGSADSGSAGLISYRANCDRYRAVTVVQGLPVEARLFEAGRKLACANAANLSNPKAPILETTW